MKGAKILSSLWQPLLTNKWPKRVKASVPSLHPWHRIVLRVQSLSKTACKNFQGQPSLRCCPGLMKESLVPCNPDTPRIPNPGDLMWSAFLSHLNLKGRKFSSRQLWYTDGLKNLFGNLLKVISSFSNLSPGTRSHLQYVLLRCESVNDANIPGLGRQLPHLVLRPFPPGLPKIIGPV